MKSINFYTCITPPINQIEILISETSIREKVLSLDLFENMRGTPASEDLITRLIALLYDPSTPGRIEDLVNTLRAPYPFSAPFWQEDEDIEYILLLAFLSNQFTSEETLTTAFMMISALKDPRFLHPKTLSVFDPEAKHHLFPSDDQVLSEDQINLWFEKMKRAPSSETYFLLFEERTPISHSLEVIKTIAAEDALLSVPKRCLKKRAFILEEEKGQPSILDYIYVKTSFRFFCYSKELRIVPSYVMGLTIGEVIAKEPLDIQLHKQFGLAPPESIRKLLARGLRPFCIPASFFSFKESAHGYRSTPLCLGLHDLIYHNALISLVPKEHRDFTVSIGDALLERINPSRPELENTLRLSLANHLFDLELVGYQSRIRPFLGESKVDLALYFWISLFQIIPFVPTYAVIQWIHTDWNEEQIQEKHREVTDLKKVIFRECYEIIRSKMESLEGSDSTLTFALFEKALQKTPTHFPSYPWLKNFHEFLERSGVIRS